VRAQNFSILVGPLDHYNILEPLSSKADAGDLLPQQPLLAFYDAGEHRHPHAAAAGIRLDAYAGDNRFFDTDETNTTLEIAEGPFLLGTASILSVNGYCNYTDLLVNK
jgi:hypothetical protein